VKLTLFRIDSEKSTPDRFAPEKFIPERFRPDRSKPARFFFAQLPLALRVQPFALAAFSAEMTIALGSAVFAVDVSANDTGEKTAAISAEPRVTARAALVVRFIITPKNRSGFINWICKV
jgi:hypothetical protein